MKMLKARQKSVERSKAEITKDTAFLAVMIGLLWVLLYVQFLSTIWVWTSSKTVAPLLERQDTVFRFKSNFEHAKALTELNTYMERSVFHGKEAISDLLLCIKLRGIKSSPDI